MSELNWKGKLKSHVGAVKEIFHKHDPEEKAYIKKYGHDARRVLGGARSAGILRSQIKNKALEILKNKKSVK